MKEFVNITNYTNISLAKTLAQLVNILFNKALGENEKYIFYVYLKI